MDVWIRILLVRNACNCVIRQDSMNDGIITMNEKSNTTNDFSALPPPPPHASTGVNELSTQQMTTHTKSQGIQPTISQSSLMKSNSLQSDEEFVLFPSEEEEKDYDQFQPQPMPMLSQKETGSPEHLQLFPRMPSMEELFPTEQPPFSAIIETQKEKDQDRNLKKNAERNILPNPNMGKIYVRHPYCEYKKRGNAVDVVVVKNTQGQYVSMRWKMAFTWSLFRSNQGAGVGSKLDVYINKRKLPTSMVLLEKGRCIFENGLEMPSSDDLACVPIFEDDINMVRVEHRRATSIRYLDCRLHVLDVNDSIVVADLDGTITISDIEGHIRTLRLGQYDFIHEGSCEFFTKIHTIGCKIIYLTARPIDWAAASRTHLDNCNQREYYLPYGPLITNDEGLTGALVTEVVNKNPHIFKAKALIEIATLLVEAGRSTSFPIFVAGFGNRPTDVTAYEAAGISKDLIFLIDPVSRLKAATSDDLEYDSYRDPNCLLYLLPKLKKRMPLEYVDKIDALTAQQVVLADELEERRAAQSWPMTGATIDMMNRSSSFTAARSTTASVERGSDTKHALQGSGEQT